MRKNDTKVDVLPTALGLKYENPAENANMNCKDPQCRTLPCILKDFCPWPTALCAIWWKCHTQPIAFWTSYQIYTCLKPHQSNIPKHLQEQVCPYKTLQYQEIQETLMAPFTEMTFASSRLWSLQDLKNCNDMTSSMAVFRKGGNFFRKVRDICWWTQ